MVEVSTIYLVRHAKAGDRSSWDGDDTIRPLSGKGRRQAVAICDRLFDLIAVHPDAQLISSPHRRCMQTLEPLAARRRSQVMPDGDVIPDVMAALQRRRTEIIGDPDWRKGTVWVLAREDGEVNKASVWAPPATD